MIDSSNNPAPNALLASAERLRQAYKELQESKVAAGYLKAKLRQYEQLAADVERFEDEKLRIAELERQNEEMIQTIKQAQLAEKLLQQNRDVREHLQESQTRIEQNQSARWGVFSVLVNGWLGQSDKAFNMRDYYRMVQRKLER